MIVSRDDIQVDGYLLNCTTMDPNLVNGKPNIQGVCLFTHGQGDYSERYTEVLHPFTERGIRCILFDLPGHGNSPGKRGHVANLEFIDKVIAKGLELAGILPYGIAGHSMGGLLTLRHLTLALQGHLPLPQYCWINSALLSPAENKSDFIIKCAKFLSTVHPQFMINTGTSTELCRTESSDTINDNNSKAKRSSHQLISAKWGTELIKASEFIYTHLPFIESDIPILYTQGGTDFICPDHLAESFVTNLKFSNKNYKLFQEMRHETFAEPNKDALFQTVATWLDKHI